MSGLTLLFFLVSQLIIQFMDTSDKFTGAEAFAVVCFLVFLPLLQFIMSLLGGARSTVTTS